MQSNFIYHIWVVNQRRFTTKFTCVQSTWKWLVQWDTRPTTGSADTHVSHKTLWSGNWIENSLERLASTIYERNAGEKCCEVLWSGSSGPGIYNNKDEIMENSKLGAIGTIRVQRSTERKTWRNQWYCRLLCVFAAIIIRVRCTFNGFSRCHRHCVRVLHRMPYCHSISFEFVVSHFTRMKMVIDLNVQFH